MTLPGHLGSVPTAMASIMRHYRDDMQQSDVFIMNDPFGRAAILMIAARRV